MKAIGEAKKNGKKVIEDLEALDKPSTSATNKTSIANSKTKISKAIEGLEKVHGFMLTLHIALQKESISQPATFRININKSFAIF